MTDLPTDRPSTLWLPIYESLYPPILAKKRKIDSKKKFINKCKKKAKTPIPKPKMPSNFKNKYSEWDKTHK